ncbi:MAG: class IV adenylate cyclase [Patescibacteria group bacterium]|nr:class IV adenylate cyclase [Patescibacteria group bacterium]MDE1988201.1 class IV adenylate cyclase [Patescibacteria group bacterium]MDE2218387.1 class IV adenylate cyclase [Patescibacteria group bacterium]
MKKEIETRFLDINKDEFVKKLISLGAIDKGEEKLEEAIFYDQEMSWKGKGKFVRLRKTKGKTKLTYKSNQKQTVDSAQEIELEVSDFDKCAEFFSNIGLKAIRQIEKFRHTFELDDTIIDIDTWPKIPVYAEIEGASVELLKNTCKQLDLDWDKRFDGDARAVFIRYGYDLDNISVITFSEFK